jgi:hypothetical protein
MKKKLYTVPFLITFSLLQLFAPAAKAQGVSLFNRKLEIGLNIGPSNFLGDLGGNIGQGKTFLKDNNVELTKLVTGAYVTYYPAEWIGVRLAFQRTTIEGDDKVIDRKGGLEEARKNRNLSFRSPLTELYLGVEFSPTVFFEYDDYLAKKFRPYAVGGIGLFKFNPQANLNGQWVDLKPLHTEGQGFPEYPNRKEYSLTQVCFPIGFGFKYFFNENFSAGVEAIHRFTTTDYIDDVSTTYVQPSVFNTRLTPSQAALAQQLHDRRLTTAGDYGRYGTKRGDPKQNDGYYSLALKLGWRLGNPDASDWRKARRQVRCYY